MGTWDLAKEIDGKKLECKNDRIKDWVNTTFNTYKCWKLTDKDSGNGRRAFDQCCKNCYDVKSDNWCSWSVNNPRKDVADVQAIGKDHDFTFGTDMKLDGYVTCLHACASIDNPGSA